MSTLRNHIDTLSYPELVALVNDYEWLERNGSIGECRLRNTAKQFLSDGSSIVLLMERVSFEAYRAIARRYGIMHMMNEKTLAFARALVQLCDEHGVDRITPFEEGLWTPANVWFEGPPEANGDVGIDICVDSLEKLKKLLDNPGNSKPKSRIKSRVKPNASQVVKSSWTPPGRRGRFP